jgi:hypothetical protein
MGPLLVVTNQPLSGHAADFPQGFEHVGVEDLLAVCAVKALDVAVLHRPPRLDKHQFYAVTFRPLSERVADQFRAVVQGWLRLLRQISSSDKWIWLGGW